MTSEYEIAFALVRGMSVDLARKILDVVESEQNFFVLKQSELEGIIGAKNRILESAYRNEILEKARREMEFVNANSIDLYYFRDAAFPQRMLDAIDAPIWLFGKGPVNLNAARLVSVVGTRHATQDGKAITDKIIGELAEMYPDVMIVSGLAYGIDVAAHQASLAHSVSTIAILGHGLNTIYPATHRSVAVDMLRHNGALLSEYTSQDAIHRGNFLARNRIVAAISDCTLVVESAVKGGAMVTASIANSYNRDVLAVPGRANDPFSMGCNALIRDNKASLVTCADDIANVMRWPNPKPKVPVEQSLFPEYTDEEKLIIDFLTQHGECHVNDIACHLNVPIHTLLSQLVDMEFNGYVRAVPGSRYTLA